MSKKVVVLGIDAALPDLIKKFINEGELPHIKSIFDRGYFSRVKTVFPPLTAAAWGAIVTGAGPGTAGIPSLMVKEPGEELDNWHSSFDKRLLKAETLWEAGARIGKKSALINWPVTWPMDGGYDNCIQVAASLNPPFRYFYMPIWDVAGSSFFSTKNHFCNQIPGRAVVVEPKPATGWSCPPESHQPPLEVEIDLPPVYAKGVRYSVLITDSAGEGYDLVTISREKSGKSAVTSLKRGGWSQWLTETFIDHSGKKREGRFQFNLVRLSADGSDFGLYASPINTAESYTTPKELTSKIEAAAGPYREVDDPWAYMDGWQSSDFYMDNLQIHADWWGDTTKYIVENEDVDMIFSWVGTVDHLQHVMYAGIAPESRLYKPEKHDLYMDILRQGYKQIDENVGKILSSLDIENSTILLVSDHGFTHNDWNPYLKHFLQKAKLLSYYLDEKTGEYSVDWSKTKCHPLEPSHAHIFINLKGRDPKGIVEPKEYKKVQDEIKEALMAIKNPETGESAMAAVLTKEEALVLGIMDGKGIDRVGDVLFAFKPGYLANTLVYTSAVQYADGTERIILNQEEHEPAVIGRHFTGAHVTLNGIPEMDCVMILSDPQISCSESQFPIDIINIAPTLAYLSDTPIPQDAEGAVIGKIVEEKRGREGQ